MATPRDRERAAAKTAAPWAAHGAAPDDDAAWQWQHLCPAHDLGGVGDDEDRRKIDLRASAVRRVVPSKRSWLRGVAAVVLMFVAWLLTRHPVEHGLLDEDGGGGGGNAEIPAAVPSSAKRARRAREDLMAVLNTAPTVGPLAAGPQGGASGNEADEPDEDDAEARSVASLVAQCDSVTHWPANGTSAEKTLAANCGVLFEAPRRPGEVIEERVRVALFDKRWSRTRRLSGCPKGVGLCPGRPNCEFFETNRAAEASSADVVLFLPAAARVETGGGSRPLNPRFTTPRQGTDEEPRRGKRFNVFFWREPSWVVREEVQQHFDFEMGVHFWSGNVNPNFLRRPATLSNLERFKLVPFANRTGFGMSAISNCNMPSMRQRYLSRLRARLGATRVHQYGKCGDGHRLPPKPINNAMALIASYKFYFSFENNIEQGYVTEKLFTVLNSGSVPVYLGAPDVPAITRGKSFINALDFESPEALADYLEYLAGNETAYQEYHAWRSAGPEAYSDAYLELVARQFPPPRALQEAREQGIKKAPRQLACCRFCNLDWVEATAARNAGPSRPVARAPWSRARIMSRFGY